MNWFSWRTNKNDNKPEDNTLNSPDYNVGSDFTKVGSVNHTPYSTLPRLSTPELPGYECPRCGPDRSIRLYTIGADDCRSREWTVKWKTLRRHAQFEKALDIIPSRAAWRIKDFATEVVCLIDYIVAGIYPIFYTESDGFNVPKYLQVRQAAEHYGVKGLVEWIDRAKYRDVVVRVYTFEAALTSPKEVSADSSLSMFIANNSWVSFTCRIVWKTELMRENRKSSVAGLRTDDVTPVDDWKCSKCISERHQRTLRQLALRIQALKNESRDY